MIKNKKGLSDVIATVLIILLAIAAIVIVWGFISNYLGKAGGQIDLQSNCLTTEVKPLSCIGTNATIQIISGTPKDVIAILKKSDGTTTTFPGTFTNDKTTIAVTGAVAGDTIKASAVYKSGDNKIICPESITTISCSAAP